MSIIFMERRPSNWVMAQFLNQGEHQQSTIIISINRTSEHVFSMFDVLVFSVLCCHIVIIKSNVPFLCIQYAICDGIKYRVRF